MRITLDARKICASEVVGNMQENHQEGLAKGPAHLEKSVVAWRAMPHRYLNYRLTPLWSDDH